MPQKRQTRRTSPALSPLRQSWLHCRLPRQAAAATALPRGPLEDQPARIDRLAGDRHHGDRFPLAVPSGLRFHSAEALIDSRPRGRESLRELSRATLVGSLDSRRRGATGDGSAACASAASAYCEATTSRPDPTWRIWRQASVSSAGDRRSLVDMGVAALPPKRKRLAVAVSLDMPMQTRVSARPRVSPALGDKQDCEPLFGRPSLRQSGASTGGRASQLLASTLVEEGRVGRSRPFSSGELAAPQARAAHSRFAR